MRDADDRRRALFWATLLVVLSGASTQDNTTDTTISTDLFETTTSVLELTSEMNEDSTIGTPSCDFHWNWTAKARSFRFQWSGSLDSSTMLTFTATEVTDDVTSTSKPRVFQASFSVGSALIPVTPGTQYLVEVDFGCNKTSKVIMTPSDVPSQPTNLTCWSKTDSSIVLTWESPYPFVGPILWYTVKVTDRAGNVSYENATSTSLEVSALSPYTEYTFRVAAQTEAGQSVFSEEVSEKTEAGVPGAPSNLTCWNKTNSSVVLTWQAPYPFVGPVLWYTVNVTDSAGNVRNVNVTGTQLEMFPLSPYTEYTFRVAAQTVAGQGNLSEEVTERTEAGVPGVPLNLRPVGLSNISVVLAWNEPEPFVGPVLSYWVQTIPGLGEQRIDGRNINFTVLGLEPYTEYAFQVCAETEAGRGNCTEELDIRTKEGVPLAPNHLQASNVSNSSVQLEWSEPEETRGPVQMHRIFWENSTSQGKIDTRNSTSYIVDGLTPFTEYTFMVLAITEAGPGQWSKELRVQTLVGVPYPPTSLRSVKTLNTSVILEWSKPDVYTGPVITYRIHWKNGTLSGARNTSGNFTFCKMEGLSPYVKYSFEVQGFTEAGPGEKSNPLTILTDVGVPHAPTSLQTYDVFNTSLSLSWMEPNVSTGPILRYRIQWSMNTSRSSEEDTAGNAIRHTIRGLTAYTTYTLRVLAITEAGPGQWSEIAEERTAVGIPNAPVSLRPEFVTNTTVVLLWDAPKISAGPLLEYTVHWQKESHQWEVNSTNSSCRIDNLTPFAHYTFSVLARTEAGPGPRSEEIKVRMEAGVPSEPRNLRLDGTTSVSLRVNWTRPSVVPAPTLDYYVLEWNRMLENGTEDQPGVITVHSTADIIQHEILHLFPYTNYTVQVWASTVAGRGPTTPPLFATTDIGVPKPAIILSSEILRRRTVLVKWRTENLFPGPTNFSLQAWRLPDPCSDRVSPVVDREQKGELRMREEWSKEEQSTVIEGLRPSSRYIFRILLRTEAAVDGVRSEASEVIRVPPEAPSEPINLEAECQWSPTRAKVKWDPPINPNGRITSYTIRYGIPGLSHQDRSIEVEVPEVCGRRRKEEIHGLQPEKRYRITVTGRVEGVRNEGMPASVECELPPGVPFLGNTSLVHATPGTAPNRVILEWTKDVFSDYMGTIVEYSVLVGREGSLGASRGGKKPVLFPPWANFSNGNSDFYQATPLGWNPFGRDSDPLSCEVFVNIESGFNRTLLRCTIGSQTHCPENQTYCNGPLSPDTGYELKIRGFTRGGYNETQIIYARTGRLPAPSIAGPIATAVILLLLLGVVSGGCYALQRKGRLRPLILSVRSRLTGSSTKEAGEDPSLEMQREKFRFVLTKKFAEHVQIMMSDSHLQFAQEFEALKNASPQLPCTVAESEENRAKNRWLNIFPFDHSRVKLLPLCDEPGSDFINANYIPGLSSQREYIATQGPLPHTVDDFWRMVWEQSVTSVVMLTQCVERGKKKCEQYWPEQGESGYYGDLVVTTVSESMLSSYTIRVLRLKLGSYERQVKQMHFTRWPDFGCPECPEDLINFVNAVRDHTPRFSPGPILVHCSAGVGRTGTYIAVDRLSRQIARGDTSVDVYGTVLEQRNHRTNMVQTEDQYIYIHLCVCQLIAERDQPRPTGETRYSNIGADEDTAI